MSREISAAIAGAAGLLPEDQKLVHALVQEHGRHIARNHLRSEFYDGHHKPPDLNISTPPGLKNLEQVVTWPAKAVNTLANRSQFDGFVCTDDETEERLSSLVARNDLKLTYGKAVKSELKHCCSFFTVTAGDVARGEPAALIHSYPATSAAALWDDRAQGIAAGMVVVDRDRRPGHGQKPTWVDVFTATDVIQIRLVPNAGWVANYLPHSMGRPLMEAMPFEPDDERPFGRSRITRSVMNLTENAMRASKRAEIGAEFATSPQKYLLGARDDVFDGTTKWDAFIGSIFAVSTDPETGEVPNFGQLSQASMQPHIDYMRSLAARFSGETNVPLAELGVVTDNPSSAEAIYAAKEALVIDAQNLNASNGRSLKAVALMALAVEEGTDYATVRGRDLGIEVRWRDPSRPSAVSQAEAITTMIGVIPWLADSDVVLEELGFSDDQIQRLKADRARSQTMAVISAARTAAANATQAATAAQPEATTEQPTASASARAAEVAA